MSRLHGDGTSRWYLRPAARASTRAGRGEQRAPCYADLCADKRASVRRARRASSTISGMTIARAPLPCRRRRRAVRRRRRAAGTRPTRRSTRSSPSASSCRRPIDDVRAAIAICRERACRCSPRGAGSSQCGQTVGAALVIDHSKHLHADRRLRSRRDDGRPSSRASCSISSMRGSSRTACGSRSTSARRRRRRSAAWRATTPCGSRSIAYGNMVHNVLAIDAILSDGTEARFGPEREMAAAPPRVARARARAARRSASASATRSSATCRRCCAASAATTSTSSTRRASGRTRRWQRQLRASPGRQRRHARLVARAHAEARAAARAPHARRRQFPDALQGDGVRAASWSGSALGGRARRPHDDRPRARQSGVPRRSIDRALIGEPDAILLVEFIGETRDDPLRAPARSRRADGRSRPAGQRRRDDRRRLRRRRCGTCARPGSTS